MQISQAGETLRTRWPAHGSPIVSTLTVRNQRFFNYGCYSAGYIFWVILMVTASKVIEISRRALRRLPILALARYIGAGTHISPDFVESNSKYGHYQREYWHFVQF
ncbi:hypothetical protein F5878DRAFT_648180 [Lentinula raphanica]|uniref:Uncharacterized protein n=1 Tax=Lentinula raphanica TaxID=153919 RepID=A0AA38NUJ4_9AGAR|nr:hypothetical protein F5878DRAFT_648180 [Lentinula raphanica]